MKPYMLQAPEKIASEYGGDKQKIMHAAQLGVVDPTAAVMAGMFIDKMRAPPQQQGMPSIAQQVFAPPGPPPGAPPPGAGGPPPGGPPPGAGGPPPGGPPPGMMGPPPGGPPGGPPPGMGMPPPMGPPPMGPPPGGLPPGMAMGGGIDALPIPDSMYDEPGNGGFAGGGMVSFIGGGGINGEEQPNPVMATAAGMTGGAPPVPMGLAALPAGAGAGAPPPAAPTSPVTSMLDANALMKYKPMVEQLYGDQPHEARDAYAQSLKDELGPASQKKSRQQDMWMALGQIGTTLATTQGPFLMALGTAIQSALPGISSSSKERKAAKRDAIKGLMEVEGSTRKEATDKINMMVNMWDKDITVAANLQAIQQRGEEAAAKIASDKEITKMQIEGRLKEQALANAGSARAAGISAGGGAGKKIEIEKIVDGLRDPKLAPYYREVLGLKYAPTPPDPLKAAVAERVRGTLPGGGGGPVVPSKSNGVSYDALPSRTK